MTVLKLCPTDSAINGIQNISIPKINLEGSSSQACCSEEAQKKEREIVKNEKSDDQLDEAKGQQVVLYRFRQRQKKIQREITSSKLIAKEEESCVKSSTLSS
ncbi:hypothetical protein R3W88_031813 [Solanum pinnatisectum]|uniref:Uncharacterized protein n=1 Tax=Solanum pinnatisectum TaxID=50273 RepID=A0AAV9LMG1_9SOLN|nr:hypothetical protein R3W88_031813 [Solanum pinnatisectum]